MPRDSESRMDRTPRDSWDSRKRIDKPSQDKQYAPPSASLFSKPSLRHGVHGGSIKAFKGKNRGLRDPYVGIPRRNRVPRDPSGCTKRNRGGRIPTVLSLIANVSPSQTLSSKNRCQMGYMFLSPLLKTYVFLNLNPNITVE